METQTITETVTDICTRLGFSVVDIEVSEDKLGTIFSVTLEGGDELAERGGVGVGALNHLVKKIVDQKTGHEAKEFPFSIDINNHQKKKNDEIVQKAKMYAERAKSFGTEIELDPMNAYERMVVHNALGEYDGIETGSRGIGRERRVVITPQR